LVGVEVGLRGAQKQAGLHEAIRQVVNFGRAAVGERDQIADGDVVGGGGEGHARGELGHFVGVGGALLGQLFGLHVFGGSLLVDGKTENRTKQPQNNHDAFHGEGWRGEFYRT